METEKTYVLRELETSDIFVFTQILSKIGVREFKDCFAVMTAEGETTENAAERRGVEVFLNMLEIILKNVHLCENSLYTLLARLSGMKEQEIAKLPPAVFMEMLSCVIYAEGFHDFFTAALKLLKMKK